MYKKVYTLNDEAYYFDFPKRCIVQSLLTWLNILHFDILTPSPMMNYFKGPVYLTTRRSNLNVIEVSNA